MPKMSSVNITEIKIKFIPHNKMRYDTWGDYWTEGSILQVRIVLKKDWRRSWGILFHELYEKGLCLNDNVSEEAINNFDMGYKGDDAGTNIKAPYHLQHIKALEVEEKFYEDTGYSGKFHYDD